jgi:hypothetical protein
MNQDSARELPPLTLLQRREIEAAIVGPLVRAFMERFGDEPSLEVLAEVIRSLSRQSGEALACTLGRNDLEAFSSTISTWNAGGALELTIIESGPERLSFDVTRCRYAEMYRRLGLADLGATLSCLRDFELVAGFNEAIELNRTQTLMQGASCCDFRFREKSTPEPDSKESATEPGK